MGDAAFLQLGVPLAPVKDEASNDLFEVRNIKIVDLPMNRHCFRVDDEYGLKLFAYEIDYQNMTKVLAGLRHCFASPVSTSLKFDRGSSP